MKQINSETQEVRYVIQKLKVLTVCAAWITDPNLSTFTTLAKVLEEVAVLNALTGWENAPDDSITSWYNGT